jgi:hypothetical protein
MHVYHFSVRSTAEHMNPLHSIMFLWAQKWTQMLLEAAKCWDIATHVIKLPQWP